MRHIRKCFRLRRHNKKGRERKLRALGIKGRPIRVASVTVQGTGKKRDCKNLEESSL